METRRVASRDAKFGKLAEGELERARTKASCDLSSHRSLPRRENEVKLLDVLTTDERSKLSDCLVEQPMKVGDAIVR